MRLKLFTLVLTILAFNARAQNEDSLKIRAIADEILLHSNAYENLRLLTKQVGGRLSGSPQTYKAEACTQSARKGRRRPGNGTGLPGAPLGAWW